MTLFLSTFKYYPCSPCANKCRWQKKVKMPKMTGTIKKYFLPITIGLIVLACIGWFIPDLFPESTVHYASRASRVKVPEDAMVIKDYSSPLSVQGDAETVVILQIPPEEIQNFIATLAVSPDWIPLPLSEYLAENEPCLQPSYGHGEIPIAHVSGYYTFRDRATYQIEEPLCKRADAHFFFGVFNEENGKLYLYNIDS